MSQILVRTQVQLSKAQLRALQTLAVAHNRSTAELIRQAVEAYLQSTRPASKPPRRLSREERKRRALAVAGRFQSGVTDLATAHDKHLAEAYRL